MLRQARLTTIRLFRLPRPDFRDTVLAIILFFFWKIGVPRFHELLMPERKPSKATSPGGQRESRSGCCAGGIHRTTGRRSRRGREIVNARADGAQILAEFREQAQAERHA